jgi:tRNA G10  N-methylase Trm11
MENDINKFFVFGNHPSLSLAELLAITNYGQGQFFNQSILAIDLPLKIVSASFIDNLGGTIKMGEVLSILPITEKNQVPEIIKKEILSLAKNSQAKFNFAFSDYSGHLLAKNFGLEIKEELKKRDINSRLVISKEKVLSSVVVSQNKLLKRGVEIIIAENDQNILIGKTEAVQDFKELSKRDYGRPERDDFSGMLPPKLARMMINLAGPTQKELVLLDPFCGSGTILTEAALAGYKKMIGGDISPKAINDSKINLKWTIERYNLDPIDCRFINRSVLNLAKVIKEKSVDLIITEPYLGPQRALNNLSQVKEELEDLYSHSLAIFSKILKDNALVVMIWPVFFTNHFIEVNIAGWEIVSPISDQWLKNENIILTKRKTLVYGRIGQKVWREILILKKKEIKVNEK